MYNIIHAGVYVTTDEYLIFALTKINIYGEKKLHTKIAMCKMF